MPTLAIPESIAFVQPSYKPGVGYLIDLIIGVSDSRRIEMEKAKIPVPDSVQVKGLIDTGATGTAMDYSIAQMLGLQPTDYTAYSMAGTRKYAPMIWPTIVVLMGSLNWRVRSHRCAVFNNLGKVPNSDTLDFSVLVGLDLLRHFTFFINGGDNYACLLLPGIPVRNGIENQGMTSPYPAYYAPSSDCYYRKEGGDYIAYKRYPKSILRRVFAWMRGGC
jgi:hypothetical protein